MKTILQIFKKTSIFAISIFATFSFVSPLTSQETDSSADIVSDVSAPEVSSEASEITETLETPESSAPEVDSSQAVTESTLSQTSVTESSTSTVESTEAQSTDSAEIAEDSETDDVVEYDEKSIVPAAKRPMKPDSVKVELAESKDIGKNPVQDKKDAIQFGIETEIISLIQELSKNDDPRFGEEIYDLFQTTKSDKVRIAVLDYFAKLKDPCIEDYAVTILNDPYDESSDLTSSVFKYIAAVKCKAAVPAVMTLLKNDNEKYFDNSLTTIGEIGGENEASVLAGYLEREDLSVNQRQTLMRVLGNIKAISTWQTLADIVENDDENLFVRSYAAEAIGAMKKEESIPILRELFESSDPNLRVYALKGLSYYERKVVQDIFIEGLRDSYYRVRLEAITNIDNLKIKDAIPSLVYRAKNDPEAAVKKACYPVIAKLDTSEGNDFLLSLITDKKIGDNTKALAIEAFLQNQHDVRKEILELAKEVLKDNMRKPLRYSIGKEFVKLANNESYRSEFADICLLYLQSSDVSTQGIGLDLYAAGHYGSCDATVHELAESTKASVNKTKARRILKMDD